MTVCLIGKSLTTLVLSKIFINNGVSVDIYYSNNKKIKSLYSKNSRTIGLSNYSIDFLEDEKILKKKDCWDIKEINLYKDDNPEIFLNFKSKKSSFFMTTYNYFYNNLETKIKKNKLVKFRRNTNDKQLLDLKRKNYEIIIITDTNNLLFKRFFSKHYKKDYNSTAFTTIINHSKKVNNIAEQYFTKFGPLAFLPISKKKTSVVFSVFDRDLIKDKLRIVSLIKYYNKTYKIKNIGELKEFPIYLSLSRNYFNRNILSFGDALHRIHPLAGQGFNMTLRDARILSELIKNNLDLGLNLNSVLEKFERKRKNSNFLFGIGVDFLHEFFKLLNKYNIKSVDKFFKITNKNTFIKKKLEGFADKGFLL